MRPMEQDLRSAASKYLDSYSTVLLMVALVLVSLLVLDPDPESALARVLVFVVGVLLYATLVLAFRSSAARPRVVAIVSIAAIPVVGAGLAAAVTGNSFQPGVIWVVALAAAPIVIVRRIFQHHEVTNETILGAISAYLLIAVAFTFLFDALSGWQPVFADPQTLPDYTYFSLVTITTLGYGDLSPVSEWGRLFAVSEAVIGQVFLVTIVARLVSLYRPGWKDESRGRVRSGE